MCWRRHHHCWWLSCCLRQDEIGRIECIKSQSSELLPSAYGCGFPSLMSSGCIFRHRLCHCSHDFRESRHCCVHRNASRLLTHSNHLRSEVINLTSQHLDFLSRCHRQSISQYYKIRNRTVSQFQDKRIRYHARVGNDAKTGQKCAVHKDENCFLCDPTWARDVCKWHEYHGCLL